MFMSVASRNARTIPRGGRPAKANDQISDSRDVVAVYVTPQPRSKA